MGDAIPKCTKGDGRVVRAAVIGVAVEMDFEDGDVVHDGCRNASHYQEDCGRQQEEGAEVVEEACPRHLDFMFGVLSLLVLSDSRFWGTGSCSRTARN